MKSDSIILKMLHNAELFQSCINLESMTEMCQSKNLLKVTTHQVI